MIDDPLAGTTFADRYVIERCIGEGGMGRVYRARHQRVSRRFAIKVLYGELATDEKMRQRFAFEAEAASRLDHPNVVSVVDFGETEHGLLYLVMDFATGAELYDLIESEAPLAPDLVIDLALQMARGLGHAHGHGLVHRDFKSENVIISDIGGREVPRIVDFGIATLQELDRERLTTAGLVLGTPAYMSPEQATGTPLDARTDLFSLGVVLYEMLSGELPFDGSALEIARQNLSSPVPALAERVPGLQVPVALESIVQRLLAKSRDDRYSDAAAVEQALVEARDLARSGNAATVTASELSRQQPGDDDDDGIDAALAASGRRPWIGFAILLAAAAVLLVGGWSLWRVTRASPVATAPADDAGPQRNAIDAAAVAVALPSVAASDAAPVRDPRDERRPERTTRPPVVAPDAAVVPDPTVVNKPVRGTGDAAGKRPVDPPAKPKPPSYASIAALYGEVGTRLEKLSRTKGKQAAAALEREYDRIDLHDAQRNPDVRGEVRRDLNSLLRRVKKRLLE